MNINDIEIDEQVPANIWISIFDKQNQLAEKYKEIENMDDLLETKEKNIDTGFGQKWLKDFSWRVTEELAEADEAKALMKLVNDTAIYEHYLEEIIDALHFLTELTIIAGYDHTIVPSIDKGESHTEMWDVVYYLGIMCNCLKNKPWKQTQMLTDRVKFKTYLVEVWANLIRILRQENLSDADIWNLYFKKNAVNKFRIRSKY